MDRIQLRRASTKCSIAFNQVIRFRRNSHVKSATPISFDAGSSGTRLWARCYVSIAGGSSPPLSWTNPFGWNSAASGNKAMLR